MGIVALIGAAFVVWKFIKKRTETKLYSEEAYEDLQDKEKLNKVEEAIAEYHKNGKWDFTKLN